MLPAVSWVAHLSSQSSMLTVSGCLGALHYPGVLPPAATDSPLWFAKSSCSPPHCSPPAAASPPMLISTWSSGSEPDPEALCFLGLGSPSSFWNLWVVSHVSAEINLCLSQEDLGHMFLPRFSSQTIMAAWKGADGLTATDPVSLYASHTQAGGTQLNPLPPSSPLAGFIFSLSPKFVMVHMHYFSWLSFCEVRLPVTYMWRQCSSQLKKKRGCTLRSALHPASAESISLIMAEQLIL